jgi:hypothetical protein
LKPYALSNLLEYLDQFLHVLLYFTLWVLFMYVSFLVFHIDKIDKKESL